MTRTPTEELTLRGKAARKTGNVLVDAISQRNRGHWSELLLLVLLGDHAGFWDIGAFTAGGTMTTADAVLIVGAIARLASQFGPGGGARRDND